MLYLEFNVSKGAARTDGERRKSPIIAPISVPRMTSSNEDVKRSSGNRRRCEC